MKSSSIAQLVLGVLALVLAAMTPAPASSSMTAATATDLVAITGMAFDDTQPGDPVEYKGLCCKKSAGNKCTPDTPLPFSWCQTTIFPIILGPGCGAATGKFCGYEDDGPYKNDVCTTQDAKPTDKCIMKSDGVCVKRRTGRCRSVPAGSLFQCKCNYNAGLTSIKGRKYCDTASTGGSECSN